MLTVPVTAVGLLLCFIRWFFGSVCLGINRVVVLTACGVGAFCLLLASLSASILCHTFWVRLLLRILSNSFITSYTPVLRVAGDTRFCSWFEPNFFWPLARVVFGIKVMSGELFLVRRFLLLKLSRPGCAFKIVHI